MDTKENIMTYELALKKIQNFISLNFAKNINSLINAKNSDSIDKDKAYIASQIEKYIDNEKIVVRSFYDKDEILTKEELLQNIQSDMFGYSFLDDYLFETNIEEINILSWKDIRISYDDGSIVKSKKHFLSAEQSKDIIDRLLHKNNIIVNESVPIATGYLNDSIRITVFLPPVYDKKLGIGASIRIINPKNLKLEDFVEFGEGTAEMLNFLCCCFRYGLSVCIAGETGSGKTTLMTLIMKSIKEEKRLITAEENVREYNLIKRDEKGYMTNNVVHLVTRPSSDPQSNVSMKMLLFTILTSNPDYVCISEMKGEESLIAISAGNTGHPVITTTHSDSCYGIFYRMLMLSKEMYDIQDDLVLAMACSAFKIVCFVKKCFDGKRRILEIAECLGLNENKQPNLKTLYEFNYKKNKIVDGKKIVEGDFVKVNTPSEIIKNKLISNGALDEEFEAFFEKKKINKK